MGQCSAQGVDQMEADFAAIQRNVVTLKTVPQKLDELEKKIKGIQVTAQNLQLSVANVTTTMANLQKELKI